MLDLDQLPSSSAATVAQDPVSAAARPSRAAAEAAVRTLIRWAGDEPTREGLLAMLAG